MATQRIRSVEKTHLDQAEASEREIKSDITPDVAPKVIAKLLGFTFAMITLPISSYFFSRRYVFNGNATWAGGFAAFIANVVLLTYCIAAFQDDKMERQIDEAERKKQR